MTGSEESAVEETTTEWIRIDGVASWARLEADGTLLWGAGAGERRLRLESDVLGLAIRGSWITVRAFEGTSEGGCCGVVGGAGGRRRARRDYVLQMADEAAARRWSDRINEFLGSLGRPKKLCVVLNPFSGKKSARKIFQNEIKPLLEAAGVLFDLKETERQNHAHEIAYKLDILQYDGIVCVSGDGILVEIVNGLLNRKDWGTAIKVPLGVIPAGTGNGMAKSLLDSADDLCTVPNATFTIIRGHRRALDVATILQNEKKSFNVLSLTWGLVADIDIESERYRWMGSARMDLYALFRVLNLRKYNGHIHFIPAPGFEAYGDPVIHVDDCKCEVLLSKWSKGGNDNTEQCKYMGPEVAMERMEWRSIDGPFISVLVHNVPFSGEDYMPAPKAEFADGYLDVIIVKDSPKSGLLEMMLSMSDGSYIKSPYILYFKVKALRLQPSSRVGQPTKGGIIDSDGEVIAGGDQPESCLMAYGPPIQMTVDKGLATIFSPK
ncbi:sphingosine kinase 1-like [Zingiber officinale]|uniref:sphingosine kinase 1-like n=1 Tax=Zingiber officinale TaxID=94328 RepID=UPI001C4C1CD0|nr:sphingosine kinase 1-like [Zingiber officinale]XP_042451685.1 sphingosine kinase 1-like [Zingiber officinale]